MSNRKPFIAGLGSGIVIASLLLQLVQAAGAQPVREPAGLPDNWQAEVAKQGYRVLTEKELQEIRSIAAAEALDGAAVVSPSPEPTATPVSAEPTPGAPSSTQSPTLKPTPAPESSLPPGTARIPGGAGAKQASDALVRAGVIDDAEAFVQALRDSSATTKIRAGLYSFEPGATVEQIIKRITTRPE